MDHHLSLEAFDIPYIVLIIKGEKKLFLKQKTIRLPITKNVLEKITKNKPVELNKLNINTAFKIAWVGFLCLEEIIYTDTKLKKTSFLDIKVTRFNVLSFKKNQYTVLYLK